MKKEFSPKCLTLMVYTKSTFRKKNWRNIALRKRTECRSDLLKKKKGRKEKKPTLS